MTSFRRHVLVTGASGFVGSACLKMLLQEDYDITAVSHRRASHSDCDNVNWQHADLTNAAEISALIMKVRPTHLLSLAWHMGPDHRHSVENYHWIQHSLELLIEFARAGGQRVVFCGSCAEYDWSGCEPLHETQSVLRPACDYGVAKAALFTAFGPLMRRLGVSAAWARLFFLYGPGENRNRLVSNVATALLEGHEALTTDGSQKRDFLHVADAAQALVKLLGGDVTGPVNIASGYALPVADIVREIARQIGRDERVRIGAKPSPPGEAAFVQADVGRLSKEVGFTPQFDLAGGLADTIAWWRAQLEREPA